ncbi:Cystatin-A1 [Orchesella cincta]|uniref:Cystatin-A1 n=1 Tax=Orchesella cincta TaxID=48709 RepID=A0A1D2MTY1_ORCCI|nr:Cystatin-A1 [Orchesella cincta]
MSLYVKFFIFSCCVFGTIMAMRVGGISDTEKESTDEVQQMVESLGSEIKSQVLATYAGSDGGSDGVLKELEEHFKSANLTAMGHKTQVVAGTNYFVRTKIGDYIFHVRIYRDLKQNASVSKVAGPKKETDPIEYF